MHMRTKKWAIPELRECPWYVDEPWKHAGRWRERFARQAPLHVEVGCGKGVATAAMAADNRNINFIAVDITTNVLGDARRNAVRAFTGENVDNLQLARIDVMRIDHMLTEEDRVERIYIQFCNPWTMHARHAKRRLTHPRQLAMYRKFLVTGGEIWFKTDDDTLFNESRDYFEKCGFDEVFVTTDLHASGFTPNYLSEHEIMYMNQGVPIKFGIYRKTEREPSIDPMKWGRIGPRICEKEEDEDAETDRL